MENPTASVVAWQSLLPQLLEEVGQRLGSGNDLQAARLVCHQWHTHISGCLAASPDRELPIISLHPVVDCFQQMLAAAATCFPHMRACQVYLSGRVPAEVTDQEIAMLAQLQHLTHLAVDGKFVHRRGNPATRLPQIPAGLATLTALQSLDLALSDHPSAAQVERVACLTGLRQLTIKCEDWMYSRVQQFATLGGLAGLRTLCLPLRARIEDQVNEEVADLLKLVEQLGSLQDLQLSNLWINDHHLPSLLAASTSLTHLSCGVVLSLPSPNQDPALLRPPSFSQLPAGSSGNPRLSLRLRHQQTRTAEMTHHQYMLQALSSLAPSLVRIQLLGVYLPLFRAWLLYYTHLGWHPTGIELPDGSGDEPLALDSDSLPWAQSLVLEKRPACPSSPPELPPLPAALSGWRAADKLCFLTEVACFAQHAPSLHHLSHLRALDLRHELGDRRPPLDLLALPTSLTRLRCPSLHIGSPGDTCVARADATAGPTAAAAAAQMPSPHLPLLQELQLRECTLLASGLIPLLAQAPQLQSLSLAFRHRSILGGSSEPPSNDDGGASSKEGAAAMGRLSRRAGSAIEGGARQLLSSCSRLTSLRLEGRREGASTASCQWLPLVPGWVAGLRSLRQLDVLLEDESNPLVEHLPQALHGLTNLHCLDATGPALRTAQLDASTQALPLADTT